MNRAMDQERERLDHLDTQAYELIADKREKERVKAEHAKLQQYLDEQRKLAEEKRMQERLERKEPLVTSMGPPDSFELLKH